MADNFVSKFTINSQGTNIDVKIKDEDARNLIAQEISDRDSAVTTITNNLNKEISDREGADTTITNNLNKEISDRSDLISKDSEGNTNITSSTANVSVTGKDVILNVDGSLSFNTKNPIKYSQPISRLNDYFNTVPYTDNNGNRYNVLCDNGNTVNLSSNNNFKNYILVGDSYAVGYAPEGNVTGWTTLLNNLLGEHLYAKIEQSGAGLSNKMTGEYNLTTRISSLTASDAVDSIICCCGRNDIDGDNISGLDQGIKDFVNACHSKFKNAKVYIGFIGWDLNKTEWTANKSLNLRNAIAEYKNVNADYVYINTDFILRQRSYMASDGKHPNQDGQNALAFGIKCALYGGIPAYTKPFKQHIYKDHYSNNNYMINETFTGGTTFLQFICNSSINYGGPSEPITLSGYELTIVKNIELDYLVPSHYQLTSMHANILLKITNGAYYVMNVALYFKDNGDGTYDLIMPLTQTTPDGGSWASGSIQFIELFNSNAVANSLT